MGGRKPASSKDRPGSRGAAVRPADVGRAAPRMPAREGGEARGRLRGGWRGAVADRGCCGGRPGDSHYLNRPEICNIREMRSVRSYELCALFQPNGRAYTRNAPKGSGGTTE